AMRPATVSLLLGVLLSTCTAAVKITRLTNASMAVLVHETIIIKCEFEGLSENKDDFIIWKKNDEPLFMDRTAALAEDRYSLSEDEHEIDGKKISELTVYNIGTHDDGQFLCGTLETEQYVGTRVKVMVPPHSHITPEVWPYVVLTGEAVTLRCTATGNPQPKIHWSRQGGSIASHVSIEGDTVRIHNVQKSDTGVYICSVNSTAGSHLSRVDMRVNDPHKLTEGVSAPWIRTPVKYMPVEMNGAVNISCEYDGNPSPQIEWLFNGARLTLAKDMVRNSIKQFAMRHENFSESILEVREATAEYFGDYSCRANNQHGEVSTVIFVTAFPSPPELSLDDDSSILTMTAMAPNGLDEFALFFRRPEESGWLNKKIIPVNKGDQTGDKTWSKQVKLYDLLESGSYELQVQARNNYGWGNKASDMVRTTVPERSNMPTASGSVAAVSSIALLALIIVQ
ncbi:hypothetical protein PFISCL1PPCAC_28018, partial [Pristionchus fissidentatus]